MLTVVTACEDKFAPGAIALYNSIKKNIPSGEIDFYCIYYGENPQPLIDKGIQVIENPPFPEGQVFPIGGRWQSMDGYPEGLNPSRHAMPAMYCRIMLNKLFPDRDRVFWVDADCIALRSFKELEDFDFNGHAVGAIDISKSLDGNFLSKRVNKSKNRPNGNSLGFKSFGCGVMLVDVEAWNERQITEKCYKYMNECDPRDEMLSVVQGVLIMVVKDDFQPIDEDTYLFNVKMYDPRGDTKIIHFPIMIPWCAYDLARKPPEFRQQVSKYWEPYR